MAVMKKCTKCKIEKEENLFKKDKTCINGIAGICRECARKHNRLHYFKNKDKREYKIKRELSLRKHDLKRKYGISINNYEDMLKSQNGLCAICNNPPTTKRLSVDHCHRSNNVRGLLCGNCNSAIGLFKDDIWIIIKAAQYIKKHR